MKKITIKNPTLLLMIGYVLGQGSSFILILILRENVDAETVGLAVLYLSLFSLSFQFSDLGNSPYGIKCLSSGQPENFRYFRIGRAISAIPFVGVTTYLALTNIAPHHILDHALILAAGAFVFGMSNPAKIEMSGNYSRLAFTQAFPWVATSAYLIVVVYTNAITTKFALTAWLTIPLFYYFFLARSTENPIKFNSHNLKNALSPLAFLSPALLGQFWGRWMFVIVTEIASISALGPVGILRSVHTAICLGFGFILRPKLRSIIINKEIKCNLTTWIGIIKGLVGQIWVPLLCITILLLIISHPTFKIPSDIVTWMAVIYGAPFWIISMVINNANQVTHNPRTFATLDTLGMIGHILGFIIAARINIIYAFFIADAVRLITILSLSILAINIANSSQPSKLKG